MDQHILIRRVTAGLAAEQDVRGLFLGGSFGRGTADAYSDVDFILLAEDGARPALIAMWRALLDGIAPIVFWNQRGQRQILLNAITTDWLRCDLVLMSPADIAGRARAGLQPLIDRDGVFQALPEMSAPPRTDPSRVRFLIEESLRVLGLLHVLVGRGEYVSAVGGTSLLRDYLAELMVEEMNPRARGGVLHLSRHLDAAGNALLHGLPYPRPERAEVIAAHYAIARELLPRARALARRLDIAWPEAFERATLAVLAKHCAVPPADWALLRTS